MNLPRATAPEPPVEGPDANGARFDAWLDRFFAFYYRFHPVDATFIGVHDYDGRLPPRSETAVSDAAGAVGDLRFELNELLRDGRLEGARRHDALLAGRHLDIMGWELGRERIFAKNPSLHTGEAVFSVIALFQRDAEPFAERTEAAISRMSSIPSFLAEARSHVRSASAAWTERAAREARAAIAYFDRGIRLLAAERTIDHPRFLPAADLARAAFEEHLAWLEPTATDPGAVAYAIGRDAFDWLLAIGHVLPETQNATAIEAIARDSLGEAVSALDQTAREIDPDRTWREQLAAASDDHPSVEGYLPAYRRIWEESRQAAIDADVLTWPDYPIEYVPIPASDREAAGGLYYLFYRCPPPFGRSAMHRYLVTPVEPAMPADEIERRLRAANHATIKLNHVVHHGGLGHHVQNWHAVRAASRFGRIAGVDGACRIAMFGAGTLVEGWACYATDLMEEIGALTPTETLVHTQGKLRMAARAIADIALHTGRWTLEETASFYAREAGLSETAARAEAVKNSMFPGVAAMYLIGTEAIHALRRDIAARDGASFSLRAFHDRVLSFGAMPVSLIRAAMLDSISIDPSPSAPSAPPRPKQGPG